MQTSDMDSSVEIDDLRRAHVRRRLDSNVKAWITTGDPLGRPHSVPVWFLHLADDRILMSSRSDKQKVANIAAKPHAGPGRDVTDVGRASGLVARSRPRPWSRIGARCGTRPAVVG